MTANDWPELPYDAWKDTYETLHMWTQVVGKITIAHAPPLNHCWGHSFHLTSRGLTTPVLHHGERTFTIQFDFVDHRLVFSTSDGKTQLIPLVPRSVAEFYRDVMATLMHMGLSTRIWSTPVEIAAPVPFETDTTHASYDPEYANRVWRILLNVARVFIDARCTFTGKASPAHFWWGSFDLALTRFSGRPAPPREGPAFMRDAYSHEVISHGFWPGNATLPRPVFYAYCAPEPAGFKEARVQPAGAHYDEVFGEFFLPYDVARQSSSPEDALTAFISSSYAAGATLGKWDRAALERVV